MTIIYPIDFLPATTWWQLSSRSG